MVREITVAHTPDADDAFMFYGISSGKVKSAEFKVIHIIQDIESLNKQATRHEIDITALSVHAYFYLKDYIILRGGASFGLDYGPIVIAKEKLSLDQLSKSRIAIPGTLTSATLLLKLALGTFQEKEMLFHQIPKAILDGEVDAGLIIHEDQIAYDRAKFHNVLDLGKWWSFQTGGFPVPLGINVASNHSMNIQEIRQFSDFFAESIRYGLANLDAAVEYAMQYARGQPRSLITRFVKMYVNRLTVDMGKEGKRAIEKMFQMAREKTAIPDIGNPANIQIV